MFAKIFSNSSSAVLLYVGKGGLKRIAWYIVLTPLILYKTTVSPVTEGSICITQQFLNDIYEKN